MCRNFSFEVNISFLKVEMCPNFGLKVKIIFFKVECVEILVFRSKFRLKFKMCPNFGF